MSRIDEERIDRLILDVDLRLREQWQLIFSIEERAAEWDAELVGSLMRAAYARGYVDAHTEPVIAQLYRDHGYELPKRRQHG